MFVVTYIHPERIAQAEHRLGRKLTAEEIEARKSIVRLGSEEGARRVAESMRLEGFFASNYEVHE